MPGAKKSNCFIAKLSNISFGVYLVHIFVLAILAELIPNIALLIPVIFLSVIIISFIISYVVSKIPFIKK